MRNLKKILALVLALVMSLSLMATAGASQFPDVDESNPYATAIDVLDELKVFQGFDDGTFKPTETLNRAQAAVLVYRIATGDVENKYLDNYTFMQQSKFTDLDGYNWAKGYINYCQNAGIVVGTSSTTFDPGAKVTGYQLLVMLLRTLGYGKAGEFADPKGWELKTATIAESEGITKNVTSGDFGAPAPRQMVAEILFRGLLTETVEYSALVPGGYTKSGETLGMREFGLEKVSGVVMANEWANINDGGDSVLAAGTTEMLVDGKSVTVNKGTELDAVGLTYNAYIANGEGSTKRALTLEAGDNTVAFNEGKATGPDTDYSENREWASIQKLADTESISIKDSTEFFVNYDQAWNEDVTSDYRISYAIAQKSIPSAADNEWNKYIATLNADDGKNESDKTYPGHSISERTIKVNWDVNDDDNVDANDVVKCWYIAIRPDYLINTIDQDIMEEIFYSADRLGDNTDGSNTELKNYAIGEVYVGTTSMKDYSDTMSWKSFKTEYFNDTKTSRRFTSAENGESLRVIDNNNDGTAEYVLKIKYTMDQVTGTYKDAPELNGFRVAAKYKDNNLSMDGEFVTNDVVVYTVIDGKLTMWPAEVLTDSIKTKTFKNITVTTEGGEVKGQSGIENLTGMDQLIMNMNDKTQYNMYLDRFGFVRAYALAQGSKYALLTEMYPTSNQNFNYIQTGRVTAEMKMGEADIDEFNVVSKDGSVFFSGYAWTSRTNTYYNTDLNYLQPAIAHLGLAEQYEGATYNALKPDGGDPSTYPQADWKRTVWQMVADRKYQNDPNLPNYQPNQYGVFDYGPVEDVATSSFSFTNVAAYTMDDDNNVTLDTAAKLAITQDGEQVYYYTADLETTGAKTWRSDWIKNGGTRETFKTAVEDGTLTPVYAVDYVQLRSEDVSAGMRHFTIPSTYTKYYNASNNGYVDATVNTEFYIVMPGSIIYKVGYDELPKIDAENVRAAYAVAKNTTAADNGRDYWVADVIVIEVSGLEYDFDSISLMYSNPFETSSSVRWIDSLNNKWKVYQPDSDKLAEMQVVPSEVVSSGANTGWGNLPWTGNDYGFYGLKQVELQEEGELTAEVVELITKDYNKYGIYAGTVQRIKGILNSSGYIDVDLSGNPYNGTLDKYPNVKHITARNVPVYRVDGRDLSGLTLSESDAYNEVKLGDEIIFVCEQGSADKFDKIAFIVDLGERTKKNDGYDYDVTENTEWLKDEYDAIISEQNPDPDVPVDGKVNFTANYKEYLKDGVATEFPVPAAITDIKAITTLGGTMTITVASLEDADGNAYAAPANYNLIGVERSAADANNYDVALAGGVITVTAKNDYSLLKGVNLKLVFEYDEAGNNPPIKASAKDTGVGLPAADWQIVGLEQTTDPSTKLLSASRAVETPDDPQPGDMVKLYFTVKNTYTVENVEINNTSAKGTYSVKDVLGDFNQNGTSGSGFVKYYIVFEMPAEVVDLTINATSSNVKVELPAGVTLASGTATDSTTTLTTAITKDMDLTNKIIKLSAPANKDLPATVTITMDGKTLEQGEDYTYDSTNGEIKFLKGTAANPIVITGTLASQTTTLTLTLSGVDAADVTVQQNGQDAKRTAGKLEWTLDKGVACDVIVKTKAGLTATNVAGASTTSIAFTEQADKSWKGTIAAASVSSALSSTITVTYKTAKINLTNSTEGEIEVKQVNAAGTSEVVTDSTGYTVLTGTEVTITVKPGADKVFTSEVTATGLNFEEVDGNYVATLTGPAADTSYTLTGGAVKPTAISPALTTTTGVAMTSGAKLTLDAEDKCEATFTVGTDAWTAGTGTKKAEFTVTLADGFTATVKTPTTGWTATEGASNAWTISNGDVEDASVPTETVTITLTITYAD